MNLDQLPLGVTTQLMKGPKLEVWVPQLRGHGNVPPHNVLQEWNRAIREQAETLVRSQGYPGEGDTEVSGYYELKTNERSVLSLSQFNYAYTKGAAHGLTVQKSLTFDAKTGRPVSLADVFKPGVDYSKRLSAIVQQQIKWRQMTLLVEFPGVRPDQDFYIADKSLVLYYQLYEITAYAFGFAYFPISVYELADIVAEDGALGRMMY
ncbi:DUF3298 domain-containing protein [Paenibacillus chartarius]|uniref:DUF3298 domain-containing protein n=1 Tax=Paenibacillus chartarius TaxID=747481 RepID=A0ABV6DUW2_9BACL